MISPLIAPDPRRRLVEQCLILDVDELLRTGALQPGKRTEGVLRWTTADSQQAPSVTFVADLVDRERRG